MRLKNLLALTLASSFLFTSCMKEIREETGSSNVTYQLSVTDAERGFEKTQSNFFNFTGGTASVSEIKFEAKGANKVEYKSNVSQTIDLASALSTLGTINVPFASYEKIEFKIKFDPTSTNPALRLTGEYTPTAGGATVPVILELAGPLELKFEKKTPTTIDANTNYTALGTLALDSLTSSIPEAILASAVQTNGQILISTSSNTAIYIPLNSLIQGLLKVEIKKN